MARERILLVDDEPNVLAGYERRLRREFSAVTAVGGAAGLSALAQQGPFAVVVADMRMPGLDGVQFLIRVREMAPDSVRVMLTGHADAETVINAINEGSVFRFLTKPCPAETLSKTLWDAIGQYRLVRAERELLDSTLNGVVEVLTDVMRVADPEARGRFPLRRDIEVVCRALGLTRDWDIKLASLLMDIGMATIPASTRAKVDSDAPLTDEEKKLLVDVYATSARLISNVPRLEPVAEILEELGRETDALPAEDFIDGSISVRATLLKILADLNKARASGVPVEEAVSTLRRRAGGYGQRVLDAAETVLSAAGPGQGGRAVELLEVDIADLQVGDIVLDDIRARSGELLLAEGMVLSLVSLERLKNYALIERLDEGIRVERPAMSAGNGG